jgi:hypothetical protein
MNQWRSRSEQDLEQLKSELDQLRQENQTLKQQCQNLKVQNDRLLKMEAQHQSAKTSLIKKRIILSRAIIIVPENMVIGDRIENSVIKIYRGINLTISDTAELINCRIIGLDEYADPRGIKTVRPMGTIEIKGMFYNNTRRRFSIFTNERVLIHRGIRFRGNVCAGAIVISDLSRVRGRFATRELWDQQKSSREALRIASNILTSGMELEMEKSGSGRSGRK